MLWSKSKKMYDFPTCVKLGVGPAWGLASFWCQSGSGSGSASTWTSDPDRHQNDTDPLTSRHKPHGYSVPILLGYESKLCNVPYCEVIGSIKLGHQGSLLFSDQNSTSPWSKINTWYGRYHNQGFASVGIHLIQIRIQHFRLNTDSDPGSGSNPDPGFWWSKI